MKYNFLLSLSLIGLLFVACEKDEEEECHPCHIAYVAACCVEGGSDECCGVEEDDDHDHDHDHDHGDELVVPIGDGDFCGDDLVAAEAPGFEYELTEAVTIMHDGEEHVIPAGVYGNGNMEIHCEEHADH